MCSAIMFGLLQIYVKKYICFTSCINQKDMLTPTYSSHGEQ